MAFDKKDISLPRIDGIERQLALDPAKVKAMELAAAGRTLGLPGGPGQGAPPARKGSFNVAAAAEEVALREKRAREGQQKSDGALEGISGRNDLI